VSARYDAIVIGAGVAGSTAAILLARAGWSVAVVEKAEFPRQKVCGECIAAANFALLDELGVGNEIAALAGPRLERVALYTGDERIVAALPPLRGGRERWGRALGRDRLDTLLAGRARARGAAVWQPWAVKSVARRAGNYECRATSPGASETALLAAPVLIDAHGSWGPEPFGHERPQAPPRPADLFAFKATFAGASLEPGLLPVIAFPGGYGGLVVADGGRLTLACCVRRDRLRAWRAESPGAAGPAVQALLASSTRGVHDALRAARREGSWLTVGPIRPGVRSHWHPETGFAIGNAAGEAHPILGEGISMAIQSATLLCRRLVAAGDHARSLHTQAAVGEAYARDWRGLFGARMHWAAVLAHLAMRPGAARVLLPVLRRRPAWLTLAARLGAKARPLDTALFASAAALAGAAGGASAVHATLGSASGRATDDDS
jgi:flavin-dependent dehydrogenase